MRLDSKMWLAAGLVHTGETAAGMDQKSAVLDSIKSFCSPADYIQAQFLMGETLLYSGKRSQAQEVLNQGRAQAVSLGLKGIVVEFDRLLTGLSKAM